MIRVVIDTNVLVSALLASGGLPEAVIDLAISGDGGGHTAQEQRDRDREHVTEKLQLPWPKFKQFSQKGVFGRDSPSFPVKMTRCLQHVPLSTCRVAGGKRVHYAFLFLLQAKHHVQARIHEAAHA
jgi:hypothetical protein